MDVRMGAVYAVLLGAVLLVTPACHKKHDSPTESDTVAGATTGTVKGRVSVNWPGNPGIGGAKVYIEQLYSEGSDSYYGIAYDTGGDATKPEHGSYTINNVPPGTYSVVAEHNEFGVIKKTGVVVVAGKAVTVDLQF